MECGRLVQTKFKEAGLAISSPSSSGWRFPRPVALRRWISGCEVCQSTHPLAPGPVARGWRGCRRSGRHHTEYLQVPGAVGEDLPGMEGPGGVGGEEELCGGRDVGAWKGSARGPKTPEGWPFLRHSMILGK